MPKRRPTDYKQNVARLSIQRLVNNAEKRTLARLTQKWSTKKKNKNKKGRYRKQRLINNRLSPVLSHFCFQNNCLFVVTEILPVVGTSEISEFMLNIIRFLKDCFWYIRGNNWNLVSGLINDWLCINQSFDTLCTIKVQFILSCTSIRLCLIRWP